MYLRRIGCLVGTVVLLAASVPTRAQDATLKRQVNEAIDKGVAYLKKAQQPDGTWSRQEGWQRVGATALAGWTLLESGEDPNSVAVQKAARAVRDATPDLRHTYSMSLAILFLDRLGDPDDGALIDSLAVRLLGGQSGHGGWVYECPRVPEQEAERLRALIRKRPDTRELTRQPQPVQQKVRPFKSLPRAIQQLWLSIREQAAFFQNLDGDNSNTQFASLALWVARRRGLPVDDGLLLIERRFRGSQWENGGWGYMSARPPSGIKMQLPAGSGPSAAMSCAGLIGLAVGHGVGKGQGKKPELEKDKALKAGLQAVGSTIGTATGDSKKAVTLPDGNRAYYYFWTLERMAVLYDLDKIGDRDWYTWGAEILVNNQKTDGSWRGEFGEGGCDTCFALLFLRRSNAAPDLTAALKGTVRDPGKSAEPVRLSTPFQGETKSPGAPPPPRPEEEAAWTPGSKTRPGLYSRSPSGLQN
jgi:hypothetical protein